MSEKEEVIQSEIKKVEERKVIEQHYQGEFIITWEDDIRNFGFEYFN